MHSKVEAILFRLTVAIALIVAVTFGTFATHSFSEVRRLNLVLAAEPARVSAAVERCEFRRDGLCTAISYEQTLKFQVELERTEAFQILIAGVLCSIAIFLLFYGVRWIITGRIVTRSR